MSFEDVFVGVPTSDIVQRAVKRTIDDAGMGGRVTLTLTRGLLAECERQLEAGMATPEELERGVRKAIDVVVDELSARSRTIDDPAELGRIAAAREDLEPPLAGMLALALKEVSIDDLRIVAAPEEETMLRFLPGGDNRMLLATLLVGGPDAARRVEAMNRALQTARIIGREGAVLGGGLAYLRASRRLDELQLEGAEAAGVESVRKVLSLPVLEIAKSSGRKNPDVLFRRIQRASYDRGFNLKTGRIESLFKAGVLDPANLPRAAIMNAGMAVSAALLGSGARAGAEQSSPGGYPPGGPPPESPDEGKDDVPPPSRSSVAPVVRYTRVTCPRRVSLRAEPFTVQAGLTVAPSSDVSKPLIADPGTPVVVHVTTSSGLDVVGEDSVKLQILADRDSEPASFEVRAVATGSHLLRATYSQSGHPLAEVALTIQVVDREVHDEAQSSSTPMVTPGNADPADFLLYIAYSDSTLTFELERRNGERTIFRPVRLETSLEQYMLAKFGMLNRLRVDEVSLDVRGKVKKLSNEEADEQIEGLGRTLWKWLIPPDLRELYARERAEWRDKTLVILSDEPFVPWELVRPLDTQRGSWHDEQPWCESLMLTRWLRPEEDSRELPGVPPPELPLTSMSIVAPKAPANQPLPAAGQEKQFLADFRTAHSVADAGVADPTKRNVMQVLRSGAYDWFHAVTHGTVQEGPTGHSPLWLDDDTSIVPDHLIDPAVIAALVEHRPAFVLNACELGQGTWALRGTSGWAKSLVGQGAGLLIAPLWNVTDRLAALFVKKLYDGLAAGVPLAKAVRQARLATREPGDPTWLAYSVYGHPNATLRIGGQHGRVP